MFTLPTITKIGGEEMKLTFREIINRLQQTYCNNIGLDYMFINDRKRCELTTWLINVLTRDAQEARYMWWSINVLTRGLQAIDQYSLYRDVSYRLINTLFTAHLCLCEGDCCLVPRLPNPLMEQMIWWQLSNGLRCAEPAVSILIRRTLFHSLVIAWCVN